MDSVPLCGSDDSVFPTTSGGIDPGSSPVGKSREDVEREAERLSEEAGIAYCPDNVGPVMTRPFVRRQAYLVGGLAISMNGMDRLFPTPSSPNTVICVGDDGSVLASDCRVLSTFLPGCRCLPLRVYDTSRLSGFSKVGGGLACCIEGDYIIPHRDGIGTQALSEFRDRYVGRPRISAEDVFHYVYAALHLLPGDDVHLVRRSADFWRLADAGSELVRLHTGYEGHRPRRGRVPEAAFSHLVAGRPAFEWADEDASRRVAAVSVETMKVLDQIQNLRR